MDKEKIICNIDRERNRLSKKQVLLTCVDTKETFLSGDGVLYINDIGKLSIIPKK